MKVLIVQLGDMTSCVTSSVLNKILLRKHKDANILWVLSGIEECKLFKFNKCAKYLSIDQFSNREEAHDEYDLLINLDRTFDPNYSTVKFKEGHGFGFAEQDTYDPIIYGSQRSTMNIFQVYARLAGESWHGEGYDLQYFPASKSKKSRAGIAVAHSNLRRHVSDNLDLSKMKLWLVPYKKNMFKYIDELNKCHHIVTDDSLTMHLSILLHKYVHWLSVLPMNTEPEFFGTGKIYFVPLSVIK